MSRSTECQGHVIFGRRKKNKRKKKQGVIEGTTFLTFNVTGTVPGADAGKDRTSIISFDTGP